MSPNAHEMFGVPQCSFASAAVVVVMLLKVPGDDPGKY